MNIENLNKVNNLTETRKDIKAILEKISEETLLFYETNKERNNPMIAIYENYDNGDLTNLVLPFKYCKKLSELITDYLYEVEADLRELGVKL